ncbi:37568_t:CDS:2, partial [Gigaspora margarita]
LDKVFSMAQMCAEINYKRSIEAAKSLEHNILANINTIFGSDRYKQTNFHDIEQESSDVIELETNENEEMEWKAVLKEWSEGLISKKESVEELESLFETEELEETEALSFNELLT